MKTCIKCGETKPLDSFTKDKSRPRGSKAQCKACRASRQRELNTRRREQIAASNASYYAAHREEALAYQSAYHVANPHLMWVKGYRRRALALGHEPVVEHFTRDDVIAEHGGACAYCGGPFEELDHYVPISKGGPHTLANVRPSCMPCNRRKGDHLRAVPADWKRTGAVGIS